MRINALIIKKLFIQLFQLDLVDTLPCISGIWNYPWIVAMLFEKTYTTRAPQSLPSEYKFGRGMGSDLNGHVKQGG